ncbi:MAG: S9 family peptidase [Bryobacteraceae bacterium]|nr:S9 family peptidase [Bryobacteraceae bacterium]
MRTISYGLLIVVAIAAAGAEIPTSWTPEATLQVQGVGSVIPSPDGSLVAYTQTGVVVEDEKSEQLTHVFLARADGSRRYQLTQGEKGASSPAFSPDGQFVYFKSDRTGKSNLYRIPVDGGEAERLTDWKGAMGGYAVSQDGKWIAFAGRKESEDEEKAKKQKRDFRVVDEDAKNHALWLIPSATAAGGKREPKQLAAGPYHIGDFDWSPDSRAIAFSHQPTPLADDWTKSDISEVQVESGAVTALAATPAAELTPRYSPNGVWLAFKLSSDPPRWADDSRIALLRRESRAVRPLAVTYDERPTLVGWSKDSASILFTETQRTRGSVYAMPLDGPAKPVYEPDRGTTGSVDLNMTGSHLGVSWESSDEPVEAYLMSSAGGKPVRVSQANTDLPKLPLGRTETVRWKSKDGSEIEGLLTYPVSYKAGEKAPLILNIHGGPAGVFTEMFLGRHGLYPLAAFSAGGYAVLRPNPRGSSGYGKKFRFANYADWGGMDYQDLMTGVDHVIGIGVADPNRMAVMGWSYGGFMTSWIITQTDRFKAAVIGAPVTNLWSFTGTADIPGFLPDYFSGEPSKSFDLYRKHSPLAHVANAKTPALILHGEADIRVPISQGYEYYQALKRHGVTAKMVVYPREPHGPIEPKFRLDIMQRHIDWVEKYVR